MDARVRVAVVNVQFAVDSFEASRAETAVVGAALPDAGGPVLTRRGIAEVHLDRTVGAPEPGLARAAESAADDVGAGAVVPARLREAAGRREGGAEPLLGADPPAADVVDAPRPRRAGRVADGAVERRELAPGAGEAVRAGAFDVVEATEAGAAVEARVWLAVRRDRCSRHRDVQQLRKTELQTTTVTTKG